MAELATCRYCGKSIEFDAVRDVWTHVLTRDERCLATLASSVRAKPEGQR